ncbi:hypothetical protein E2C01_085119 [Portunus trituberculatus]|uniref:Uncharacterized protein n=1 Tax=Portunus trituberculatus TaxID=210409 RepID=A0A5B7J9K9_PORTR|nr:hypothetical protein [Portunus trituberculatus]
MKAAVHGAMTFLLTVEINESSSLVAAIYVGLCGCRRGGGWRR